MVCLAPENSSTDSYFLDEKIFYLNDAVDNIPVFNNSSNFYFTQRAHYHFTGLFSRFLYWPLSTQSILMWMLSLPLNILLLK